jgi:hypothetical protein
MEAAVIVCAHFRQDNFRRSGRSAELLPDSEKSALHSNQLGARSLIDPILPTSIYNAARSLARFENKNIWFHFDKRSSLPTKTLAL